MFIKKGEKMNNKQIKYMKWTKDEIKLFEKGLSNKEIAELTKKPIASVYSKRYLLKKREKSNLIHTNETAIRTKNYLAKTLTQEEKLDRIYKIAKEYHIEIMKG